MRVYILFLIILASCLTTCSHKTTTKDLKVIDVGGNFTKFQKLSLSQIASDIRYIPFETQKTCILKSISSLDMNEKWILLADNSNCFLFDLQGRLVSSIGRYGKGPGEYLFIGSVKITDKFIYVPDSKKLIVYDHSGNYVRTVDNPSRFEIGFVRNWMPLSDNLFICHVRNSSGQEENKAIIFSEKSTVIHGFRNYVKFSRQKNSSRSDDGNSQFYFFDEKLSFKEYMNDTLFRLNDLDVMEPVYVFELGKYKFPDEYRGMPVKEYVSHFLDYIWIDHVYETADMLILKCASAKFRFKKKFLIKGELKEGPAPLIGIYQKNSDKFFFVEPSAVDDGINPTGIMNDIDGGMNFFPMTQVNDSSLVMWIQPYELKNHIKSDAFKNSIPKYPEKKKDLKKLANNLNENDNPVLMLIKLKE
ncbi:MAG: 6-bladed beta-propeller [Mangrovibacterium sp.]